MAAVCSGINARGRDIAPQKDRRSGGIYAKGFGARGLAYVAISEDGTVKSLPCKVYEGGVK